MAQPSVIVFSSSDVENIPMLSDNNIFTGVNSFTSTTSITAPIQSSGANLFIGTNSFTSNVSMTASVYMNTFNASSLASIGTLNINTANCLGYYTASGATGYAGTISLATIDTLVITGGIITDVSYL